MNVMKRFKTLLVFLAMGFMAKAQILPPSPLSPSANFTVHGVHIKKLSEYTSPFYTGGASPANSTLRGVSLVIEYWLEDDPELYGSSWESNLELSIRYPIGSTTTTTPKLKLSRDENTGAYRDYDRFQLDFTTMPLGVEVLGVTLTDASGSAVSDELLCHMHVRFSWVLDWHHPLNKSTSVSVSESYNVAARELELDWSEKSGAVGYDLEWIFLSDGYATGDHKSDALVYDFGNAVRLRLDQSEYNITMAYPKGSLIYRIRAVGETLGGEPDPGRWSYEPATATLAQAHVDDATTPCVYYLSDTEQLEKYKNWQYSATFIENGKKKEVLNFADGSLRNRQAVTLMGGNALVGETKYDLDGRPALNVLPSPVAYDGLEYYSNAQGKSANGNEATGEFDKQDFFSDAALEGVAQNPPAMSKNTSLSSQYYSDQNPLSFENKSAIPDASGWVYSQTKFLNDGTDRPSAQSGVGKAFQLNGNHSTRYYYGKPTQIELDRLFGSEVGFQAYYQKNMVVDANGQVSVSYLDNQGRVIATALAGNPPSQLDALPAQVRTITTPLFEGQKTPNSDGVISSSFTMLVSSPNTQSTISYELTGEDMLGCSGSAPCKYDVSITVYNAKGESIQEWRYDNVSELRPLQLKYTFQDIGSYTITREVKLASRVIQGFLESEESHLNLNKEDNDCVPYFLSDEINCPDGECASMCWVAYTVTNAGVTLYLDDMGNYYKLINNDTQYEDVNTGAVFNRSTPNPVDMAIAQCELDCESEENDWIDLNPCDLKLNKLLVDLSPGGQYFDNSAERFVRNPDGTMVVYDNEGMPTFSENNPLEFDPEGWLNDFIPTYIEIINNANGTDYSSRAELIANWDISYAQSLLLYHPEYYAYEFFCLGVGGECDPTSLSVDQNTIYDYLNLMYAQGDDVYAISKDLFNPLGLPLNSSTPGMTMDHSNYMTLTGIMSASTSYSSFNQDPITQCIQPGSLGKYIHDFLQQRLTQFVEVPGAPGNYYSLWFLLDDPYNFQQVGVAPNNDIEELFQAVHGGGSSTAMLDVMTKYEAFRAIYAFYRDWAIYDYFDNVYLVDNAKLAAPYFNDAATLSGEYILWDYDDPTYYPGAPTPLMAIDAILSPHTGNSPSSVLALLGMDLNYPRNLVYDFMASGANIQTLFNGSQFDPATNGLGDLTNEALDCKCDTIIKGALAWVNNPDGTVDDLMPNDVYSYLQSVCSSLSISVNDIDKLLDCSLAVPDYSVLLKVEGCLDCTPDYSDLPTCEEIQAQRNLDNANYNFQLALNYYLHNLRGTVNTDCLSDFESRESVSIQYTTREHHYTLYYYDQAGNLVKTVPPKGVTIINNQGDFQNIAQHRGNKYTGMLIVPDHKMVTRYSYNSLNQLVEQHTPDGGLSKFWYDTEGRLVVSENAQQRADQYKYSYSLYDQLSRIVEVGELSSLTAPDPLEGNFLENAQSWITGNSNYSRTDVVHTYYTTLPGNWSSLNLPDFSITEKHNRNRVVGSLTYESLSGVFDTETVVLTNSGYQSYDHATYYNYDIHGNVNELEQDYMSVADRKKNIKYDYDLLSGNVNQVVYQKDKEDEFRHRYSYDADNRIQSVETSIDGVTWSEDANYTYYPHGPLSRMELGGAMKVQGMDYAYTLQGWLKYINGASVDDPSMDIGRDGLAGSQNQSFLPTAFSYALGYYYQVGTEDYVPINISQKIGQGYFLHSAFEDSQFAQTNKSLYNGNISYTISGLPIDTESDRHLVNLYRYDQLNRITNYQSYKGKTLMGIAVTPSYGNGGIASYSASYAYDANGNITSLERKDGSAVIIDDISYTYDAMTGANPMNQLRKVIDTYQGASGTDLHTSSSGINYQYDAIGNLIEDDGKDIEWTVQGKVRSFNNNEIEFTYDASGNRVGKLVQSGGITEHFRYVLDASGNVMARYQVHGNNGKNADEHLLYGSSRLGRVQDLNLQQPSTSGNFGTLNFTYSSRTRGFKEYELSNHLGNVMVTLADVRNVTNQTNNAITLSGAEYIALPQYYQNESIEELTAMAWVRTSQKGGSWNDNWAILDFDRSDFYSFYVREDDGKVGFSMREFSAAGNIYDYSSNTKVNDGKWHHLAVVYDGPAGELKFYVDGILDKTVSGVVSSVGKSGSTRFGFIGDGSESAIFDDQRNNKYFKGSLDEVRYWHEALSDGQIAEAFGNALSYSTNLQAHYTFDDGSLGGIADASGNGLDGMLFGSAGSVSSRIHSSVAEAIDLTYSDYYPFGMVMPGRNSESSGYKHGFNGKEKDNELKGFGNSYDFGARMYNPRIGRWSSIDPMFTLQPGWSTYKGFYNNPILYIDPSGKTEYITIMTINKETGEVLIEQGTANKIMTDGIHPGPSWTKGNPFHTQRNYYDYETVTINFVDGEGNVLSTSSQSEIMYENGVVDTDNVLFSKAKSGHTKTESWADKLSLEGDGGTTSRGGFTLVTEGGVISPTKFRTTAETRTINIDLLVAALGGITPGRAGGTPERWKNFGDAAKKIAEAVEGVDNMSTSDVGAEQDSGTEKENAIGFRCDGPGCRGDTIITSDLSDTANHPRGSTTPIYE